MKPHALTPDWAVSCMERITKFDDPDVLEAALELIAGLADFNGDKGDCVEAALDYGYARTEHFHAQRNEHLGIAS